MFGEQVSAEGHSDVVSSYCERWDELNKDNGEISKSRRAQNMACSRHSITMNKASGGDGIPVELFQILKDDAAPNMPANLENLATAVATGLEKVSFHSHPK